jgi:hypothetical protein
MRLLAKEAVKLHPSHDSYLRSLAKVLGINHFHGVTGGVYKTRERIHRDEADSRLLAIPAS